MQDKKTLISIIVLLVIFIPLSVLGTIKHFEPEDDTPVDDNPNKELIYEDKVYLYDDNGVLLDTYNCDDCSKAEIVLDESEYHTNYYKNGNEEFGPVIDENWAIFMEDDDYALYNLAGHMVGGYYQSVKNYKVGMTNKALIYKYNGEWGVTFLDNSAEGITSSQHQYEYLTLCAHLKNNLLDTSYFISKRKSLWFLLDNNGNAVTVVRSEIVDYSSNYIVTYDDGYHIFDLEENEYLQYMTKDKVFGIDKYIVILVNNVLYFYENCNAGPITSEPIPDAENIYFSVNDDGIGIILDGNLYKTVVF